MPKVKLTLTVEKTLLQNAKQAAQERRLSLSNLIEQLLVKAGIDPGQQKEPDGSVAKRLRGAAKGSLTKKTDRQIRDVMNGERHGI